MTDNQNPLQELSNMKSLEGQPPATAEPSAEELAAQQEQEEALAAEKLAAQARIQELEEQKSAQDQEEIAQLREELPGALKDDASVEEAEGDASSTTNGQAENKSPQVEQLKRLD